MKQSSVSPDLWETMVPQPLLLARRWALMLSVTVPIWFTLSSRQLQAFFSTAVLMRIGLVTVRSSPTIWMGGAADLVHLEQQTVASLLLHSGVDADRVGDGKVITHDLDGCGGRHLGPVHPVVLIKGILNGGDGELFAEVEVHLAELVAGDLLGAVIVVGLEVEIVHVVALVEL